VVEAYPALVARRVIGRDGYKNDQKSKQTAAHREARERIVAALADGSLADIYGFAVDCRIDLVSDGSADMLDSVLCAVQAAWAWRERDRGYGAPDDLDALEGFIADPAIRDRG
jgi:hypothetical protein